MKEAIATATDSATQLSAPSEFILDVAWGMLVEAPLVAIWLGKGLSELSDIQAARRLANPLKAPVFTTHFHHENNAHSSGVAEESYQIEYLENADVILALGTSFSLHRRYGYKVRFRGNLIRVDLQASRLQDYYPATLAIQGDARRVLDGLNERLRLDQAVAA